MKNFTDKFIQRVKEEVEESEEFESYNDAEDKEFESRFDSVDRMHELANDK